MIPFNVFQLMDIVSEEQRSYNMSRIRSKDTKPELMVRSILHRLGYRFTVNGPRNKTLPGKPDIVLPKYKTVIFVHGCFWHLHKNCKYANLPKTRKEWWKAKLEGNVERDEQNQRKIRGLGWRVLVVWECEIKSREQLVALEHRLPALIAGLKYEVIVG